MMFLRWLVLLLFLVHVPVASAQEWPRFRGPNGSGLAPALKLPVQWTERDYLWRCKIPGQGWSSPVLWGEKLFVTSSLPAAGKRLVLCLDAANGQLLWQKEFAGPSYKMHKRNSVATSTPAVDAQRLYLAWATPAQLLVQALTHEGKLEWEIQLGQHRSKHGFGVSPILVDDLLIVPHDQDGAGANAILGVDTASGRVRWKTPRQASNATYSTPCLYQPPGKPAEIILTNWQHGITSLDPKTGQVRWEISVFEKEKDERAISSPVVAGNLILGTSGFVSAQKHLVAVQPGLPEKGSKAQEIWRYEKAVSHMGTPLIKEPWVFLFSERGIVTCLELASGKVVWQERVDGTFSSSPVAVGDRLYCVSDQGDCYVLAARDRFQLLGRTSLGESTQATPAVANRRLYFRTSTQLLALGEKR